MYILSPFYPFPSGPRFSKIEGVTSSKEASSTRETPPTRVNTVRDRGIRSPRRRAPSKHFYRARPTVAVRRRRKPSHAVGSNRHRPLVNRRRYPRETSSFGRCLWIFPRTGRHLIVLGQRHSSVTVDPRSCELHVRDTVPRTVRLIVPQQILQLLHNFPLVLQMADLVEYLLQQGVGYLGRRGLKGSGRDGCFHPSSVSIVLNTTVRTLPGQALSGWTFPGKAGGACTAG